MTPELEHLSAVWAKRSDWEDLILGEMECMHQDRCVGELELAAAAKDSADVEELLKAIGRVVVKR